MKHIQELVNLLEEASNYNNYNKKQKDKPGVSGYFKVGYLVVRPSVRNSCLRLVDAEHPFKLPLP